MIETCKDCRYCKRLDHSIREWDKDGVHVKTWRTYWCNKFKMEVPPINRCDHINEPVKYEPKPEIVEIE